MVSKIFLRGCESVLLDVSAVFLNMVSAFAWGIDGRMATNLFGCIPVLTPLFSGQGQSSSTIIIWR